jgi:acetyl-CoA/propionyl-CoA carboxylase biotin carboxyl carrier protein
LSGIRLRQGAIVREISLDGDAAILDGRRVSFVRIDRDGRLSAIRLDGQSREQEVRVASDSRRVYVWCGGNVWTFTCEPAAGPSAASTGRGAGEGSSGSRQAADELLSPMPGRVRRVLVATGARVSRGEVVVVLEAMKMEHAIRAPRDGVLRLCVAEGDLVEAGVELATMTMTKEDGPPPG